MKILFLTSGVNPIPAVKGGAVENLVENLMKVNEVKKKFDIEVYSIFNKDANEKSKDYSKSSVTYIKSHKIAKIFDNILYYLISKILKQQNNMKYRDMFKRLSYIKKVKKKLATEDYDKVIIENHPTLLMAFKGKCFEKYKGRYYFHLHNELKSLYGCDKIFEENNKVMCVSNFICENVKKYSVIEEKKLKVLYNCIDTEKFNKRKYEKDISKIKERYGIDSEFVIVFSGRLTKEKGIFEIVEAIRNLKNKDIKLVIIGAYFYGSDMESEYTVKLKKMVEEIKDKVIFTGYVDYDEIPKYYAIGDIAILPSMWEEPAGLTIIEAMAMRLPVITTYSGGIPEYVNSEGVYLLERNEKIVSEIVKHIEKLLLDKEMRLEMGILNEQFAQKYNLENYYNNFSQLLLEEEF